jgi:hypothetical protein
MPPGKKTPPGRTEVQPGGGTMGQDRAQATFAGSVPRLCAPPALRLSLRRPAPLVWHQARQVGLRG